MREQPIAAEITPAVTVLIDTCNGAQGQSSSDKAFQELLNSDAVAHLISMVPRILEYDSHVSTGCV